MKLEEVILRDTRANQPAANAVPIGTIYYVTDESVTERSDGASWEDISDAGTPGAGGINELTGDVTAGPGVGSQVATIVDDSVTYAKLQDVSAALRALGRKTAGAGNVEELTIGDLLDFFGAASDGDIITRSGGNWTPLSAGASGEVLTANGPATGLSWQAAPGGSGGDSWTTVTKGSDQDVTNSATPVDATDLSITIAGAGVYLVEFWIFYSASSTACDFKAQFLLPTFGSDDNVSGRYIGMAISGGVTATQAGGSSSSSLWPNSAVGLGNTSAATERRCFQGHFVMDVSAAGTLKFQFAQWVQQGSNFARCKAGSIMRMRQLV